MYYSYIEIEYVATSFSPARTDLALKLLKHQSTTQPHQLLASYSQQTALRVWYSQRRPCASMPWESVHKRALILRASYSQRAALRVWYSQRALRASYSQWWWQMTVHFKTSFVVLWYLAEFLSVHRVWWLVERAMTSACQLLFVIFMKLSSLMTWVEGQNHIFFALVNIVRYLPICALCR